MTTRSVPPSTATGFAALGLDARLLAGLTTLGYEEPTPIQVAAIPPLLAGRDLLAQAATGTGKTAAFALPALHVLRPDASAPERTAVLILVPTRELAMQVAEAVHRYGRVLGVQVLPLYGGASMGTQIRALRRGVDVVVATPGRALDHIRRETLRLQSLNVVVLDEADEMLDMGFAEDLEAILAATPAKKQTALFSATLPARIVKIARTHLHDPVTIQLDKAVRRADATPKVRQVAYIVTRPHKIAALSRVLDVEHPVSAIVFCRTRTEVDELAETLSARGYRADALHGGLSQDQRDNVMRKFRARKTDLLIATDVAARGLDVRHVSHVVNYDVPVAADAYVHRIGRTGRAGRTGVAITFAEPREHRMLGNIERVTKQRIEIAPVPTVADLEARRRDVIRTGLREIIVAGDLDVFRGIVAPLGKEFDLLDVAAAALKQGDRRPGSVEPEIPVLERPEPHVRSREREPERRKPAFHRKPAVHMTAIEIGGGRNMRLTPGDLVGAMANEVGVSPRAIGTIRIDERYAIVDVATDIVDDVVAALRKVHIKGKRLPVHRAPSRGGVPPPRTGSVRPKHHP
jgi:ATP-dependent RNA helicase DeaD